MTNSFENNKRIAKNAILLYFRMFLTLVVSFYTSRVVLEILGVEDFGIYNAVGGIVAVLGFINSAMTISTQRYLTFELGQSDVEALRQTFSSSLIIHGLLSIFILFLGETAGLWFLYEKMIIPAERIEAALWVYQFSIFTTLVSIMSAPYNAAIVAHERMSAFAYISVLEVLLKLAIVFLLQLGDFDRLKLYAILMFGVQFGIRIIYSHYCSRHFQETKFYFLLDKKKIRNMLNFTGWSLWGSSAAIFFTQGLNILLNIFFGPSVNAARGIAVQVQSAVLNFSSNFQTALNPQITKSYAVGDLNYMHSLIYRSSKFSFFLLFFLSLPIFIETEKILSIWLTTVPEYTVIFVRLILCITIIDAIANPLMTSASATGKIRFYQSLVGGILVSILPISYIVLKLGGNPYSVFIVHLCICIIAFITRLYIICPMIQLQLSKYTKQVIFRCLSVFILSIIFPLLIRNILNDGLVRLFTVCITSTISIGLCVYYIGLNVNERHFLIGQILKILYRVRLIAQLKKRID